ncbi:MAG: hypothetical protein M0T75_04425 [Chloroflexi bacterium]|nr:hypothetical protein [Chloroflexota bacterium]
MPASVTVTPRRATATIAEIQKLVARNRAEAAPIAEEKGWLDPTPTGLWWCVAAGPTRSAARKTRERRVER